MVGWRKTLATSISQNYLYDGTWYQAKLTQNQTGIPANLFANQKFHDFLSLLAPGSLPLMQEQSDQPKSILSVPLNEGSLLFENARLLAAAVTFTRARRD